MVVHGAKLSLVLTVLLGLSGCSEENRNRVDSALDEAAQAMDMLGHSGKELAEVAWLESRQWLGESLEAGESLVKGQQQAFNNWRQPVSPVQRYVEVEVAGQPQVTGAPGEGPSQEHSNKEESPSP